MVVQKARQSGRRTTVVHAAAASIDALPPARARGFMSPKRTLASVIVGSVPPRPSQAGPGAASALRAVVYPG